MTSVLIGLISLAAVRAISWDLGGRELLFAKLVFSLIYFLLIFWKSLGDQWDIGSIGANPGKIEQNFYGPKTASNESGIKDPGENIGESKGERMQRIYISIQYSISKYDQPRPC